MAAQKLVSTTTILNFEEIVSDLQKNLAALNLLWHELCQPKLSGCREAVRELMWDRLSLLDQSIHDVNVFFSCLYEGRDFGVVDNDDEGGTP